MFLTLAVWLAVMFGAALLISFDELLRWLRHRRRERAREQAHTVHVDLPRVEAHVEFPWHEDPIELDAPLHRNGNGRTADDAGRLR